MQGRYDHPVVDRKQNPGHGQDKTNNEERVREKAPLNQGAKNEKKECRTHDDGSPAQDYVCSLARVVREPTTTDPQGGLFRKEDSAESDESDENGRHVGEDTRATIGSSMSRVVQV